MQLSSFQLAWGFTLVSSEVALSLGANPAYGKLNARAITPDNTCGGTNAYTCNPSDPFGGPCCSATGWCGKTSTYCGSGCQPAFGDCTASENPTFSEFECGPEKGNQKCGAGLCCSVNGFCGSTADYCGNCLTGFGECSSGGTGGGRCGSSFGGARCPSGQCCSSAGFCGTTSVFCQDPDCQFRFGRCDSDTTPAGTSTLNDPRPRLGSVSYTQDIVSCTKPNVVALTYDDGPYIYTAQLLDLLKRYGFKATFFVTGNNLGKGPIDTTPQWSGLIKRMVNEGHQIASHTWSHYSLTSLTSDQRKQQMVKNERAIANIIGKYPTYMRPPFSQCDDASGCNADMQALGYHRIYFDLDTQDTVNFRPSDIQKSKDVVQRLLGISGVTDYLAIQHDLVEPSVTELSPFFFEQIKAKGWRGVTAGECLEDPEANWYRVPGGGRRRPQ